jgi:hypothetical protein
MRGAGQRFILISLCLLAPALLQAQRGGRGGGNGTTISLGPVVGFYKLHSKHAVEPTSRMSFAAGVRREFRADREYRSFVQVGAEYFIHGLSYYSYYFSQDTLQLYDNSFGYRYSLYVHEVNVPIQLKVLFNRGDNKLHSPYACVAYQVRYLVQGNLEVDEFGNKVKRDYPVMKFRNFLFHERVNAYVSAGIGFQRNKISDRGAFFFAELTLRYGFSDYYFEAPYAANSVFISATHLSLMLGLKL